MYATKEAVDVMADRLGLMPRDLFAQFARGQDWRWDALDKGKFPRQELRCRQTGRTTTLILDMLCWMEEHPTEIAYVIAVDSEQAEYIRKTAMNYAEKIGLDKTHVKVIRNKPEQLRGLPDDAHILRDNTD